MLGELFDPKTGFLITEHYRSHWSQAGAIVFITFRTHDSIPEEVLRRWEREKQHWLVLHAPEERGHWRAILSRLNSTLQHRFHQQFHRCREEFLDQCQGDCVLKQPHLAKMVAD